MRKHYHWKIFFLLLLIYGCKRNSNSSVEENQNLYPNPIIIPLNTSNGYLLNKITGDSIKTIKNDNGKTIQSSTPIPFKGKLLAPIKISITEAIEPTKIFIQNNISPIAENLQSIPVDTTRLIRIKVGKGDQSLILRNSFGVVQTGTPIPIFGKKLPAFESKPEKALPFRIKDGATTNIQYLDVEQGLSFSYVYSVLEDKKGSLWFGMDGTGLSKYDGKSFTNYSLNEGLTGNTITALFEDHQRNIWIGTGDGISMYDGVHFTQFTEKEGLSNKMISVIQEDKKGNLWFGSLFGGISKYDGKNITHYTRKEGLLSDSVFACIEDKKGNIWIGTYNGAIKFDGSFFTYFTKKDGLVNNYVSSILEDRNGNIWMGSSQGGVSKFNGTTITQISRREGFTDNLVRAIIEDKNANLWFATNPDGLFKFDGKNFTHYHQKEGITNSRINGFIEDKKGNIWFGTDGGGINKLNKTSFSYLILRVLMNKLAR